MIIKKFALPAYKEFLISSLKGVQWPMVEDEMYRREWTKDVSEFAKHYRNIDVLFAPLDCNGFNEVKSELKFIEAGLLIQRNLYRFWSIYNRK